MMKYYLTYQTDGRGVDLAQLVNGEPEQPQAEAMQSIITGIFLGLKPEILMMDI